MEGDQRSKDESPGESFNNIFNCSPKRSCQDSSLRKEHARDTLHVLRLEMTAASLSTSSTLACWERLRVSPSFNRGSPVSSAAPQKTCAQRGSPHPCQCLVLHQSLSDSVNRKYCFPSPQPRGGCGNTEKQREAPARWVVLCQPLSRQPLRLLSGSGGPSLYLGLLCFSPRAVWPEPMQPLLSPFHVPNITERHWGHQRGADAMHESASPEGQTACGVCGSTSNISRQAFPDSVGLPPSAVMNAAFCVEPQRP